MENDGAVGGVHSPGTTKANLRDKETNNWAPRARKKIEKMIGIVLGAGEWWGNMATKGQNDIQKDAQRWNDMSSLHMPRS